CGSDGDRGRARALACPLHGHHGGSGRSPGTGPGPGVGGRGTHDRDREDDSMRAMMVIAAGAVLLSACAHEAEVKPQAQLQAGPGEWVTVEPVMRAGL